MKLTQDMFLSFPNRCTDIDRNFNTAHFEFVKLVLQLTIDLAIAL